MGADPVSDAVTEEVVSIAIRGDDSGFHELVALVEALLLASPGPTTPTEIAWAAQASPTDIERVLKILEISSGKGWVLHRHGAQVQLATAPRFARQVRRLLGIERETRLSSAALETLAIVAYQQPVTRSAIEGVRGVDSTAVLATLISRGLIESLGRSDAPGQPFEYVTTPVFLRHFGLQSLSQLPDLGSIDGAGLGDLLRQKVTEATQENAELELVSTLSSPSTGELANP
jgi:segregation and condensation protein B